MQPIFAFLVRSIDLNVNIKITIFRVQSAIQFFRQAETIQRMEFPCKTNEIFDLVCLQMADNAPTDRQIVQGRLFVARFLKFIFSEIENSGRISVPQDASRDCFVIGRRRTSFGSRPLR